MLPRFFLPLLCAIFFSKSTFAEDRTFTDDSGRKMEAELIGFSGENVVLKRNGRIAQWPLKKLSKADIAYAQLWKKSQKSSPKILVRIWEREGIGEMGVINEGKLAPKFGKNIPLLKKTEEKAKYKHYDIDLHNDSPVDASNLILAYVLYVITPSRQVIGEHASEMISTVGAGKRYTLKTQGVTYVRTKVTSTTIGTNLLGRLQIGSETDRSKETFGGIWVRVYSANGEMVGETKKLIPQLEKMNPQWVSEKNAPTPPAAASFEQLEEMLAPLKEFLENLPKRPERERRLPRKGKPPFPPLN